MSQKDAAWAIADKIRCTPGTVDREARMQMWSGLIADEVSRARAEAFEECARIAEMRWLAEPEGFLCADPHAAAAMRARGIADEIRRRAKP